MTETMETPAVQASSADPRPPFAWAGVGVIAALGAVALAISLGRYGFFGDELYFVAAGRRLDFGYADQGPLVPAIARAMDLLAPGSLIAQRIPAALVTVAATVLSAVIARELGGNRIAQTLTALAYATAPFLLVQGTQLATNTIDTALWVLITWLVIRWVRTRQDWLLLGAALATALDMQVKWLIPFFWITLVLAVLAVGPRDMLRRPLLWIGGVLAVLLTVPSLIWQARNGWPQLDMGGIVAAEQVTVGGRYVFLPLAIALAGLVGGLLLTVGIWALLRWEPLRPYRFLGLMQLLLMLAFLVSNGRPYYVAGTYAGVIAAGAVWWTRDRARWRVIVTVPLLIASLALIAISLPLQPESDIAPVESDAQAGLQIAIYGRFGWTELRDATTAAYQALPADRWERTVIIADSYWQASALDVERERYRLPAVYSPNRGFGYFGTPPDTADTVIWVGGDGSEPRAACASVSEVGKVDARLGYPGVTRDVTIWRCDEPRRPWSAVWPGLLRLN